MIEVTAVVERVRGIDVGTLEVWVQREWIRPRRVAGAIVFEEIDIARVRLIVELRDDLDVGEAAMPVVLSLLDQLHGTRARLHRILGALETVGPQGKVAEALERLGLPP